VRRRRLLCLLPNLNGGGAERVMVNLVRGLDRSRWEITLALARRQGPYESLLPGDIEVIDFGVSRGVLALPGVIRLLASHRFDVCFSMLSLNLTATLARLLIRARTPLVLGARNHYSRSMPAEATFARGKQWAIRKLYPRAELIIGVSQGVCDDLVEQFGVSAARSLAIPNPIDLENVRAQGAAEPGVPWFEATDRPQRPTIIAVGKLMEAKGHRYLIDAMRTVGRRHGARLIILGDGPLRPTLEAQVRAGGLEEVVLLPGFQKNPYQFIARSTVFVLPSLWEGFPNVLTEAMACGTPVVATDCPSGPAEIITDGANGLLIPPRDVPALEAALDRLLGDEAGREALRARAASDVEQYGATRILARYSAAFEAVAEGRPPPFSS
jgi:glycosyltransferase involved in cell wall biosynthesis